MGHGSYENKVLETTCSFKVVLGQDSLSELLSKQAECIRTECGAARAVDTQQGGQCICTCIASGQDSMRVRPSRGPSCKYQRRAIVAV
eukprot:1819635-Alexandrium_andersonii.AAC.1